MDLVDEERCEGVPGKAAVAAACLRNRHPERFDDDGDNTTGDSSSSSNNTTAKIHIHAITGFRSLSGILLRFGLIALAILSCIGSQFQTLRRLHEIDGSGGSDNHPPTIDLQPPPKRATRTINPRPLPVSSERQFGTGLISRIHEESLRSKTKTTKTETTTRTRTIGAAANAANGKRLSWPVLGTEQSLTAAGTLPYGIRDGQSNKITWTVLQSPVVSKAVEEEPEAEAEVEPTEELIPESPNIAPVSTIKTATTTRTRTTGIAAASASSKRIAWPVLNVDFAASDRHQEFGDGYDDTFGFARDGDNDSSSSSITNSNASLGNYKIVGFTDYKFREVAIQWYQRLEDLGYREHVLVTFDNAVTDYLQSLNEERAYELARANETDAVINSEFEFDNETTIDVDIDIDYEQGTDSNYFYRFEKHLLPPVPKEVLKLRREQRHRKGREMIFASRWHYVLGQLQAGTSILLTDVDNLFNRHLDLREDPDFVNFDVVHSHGVKPPRNPLDDEPHEPPSAPGLVVGSGMSWLKATPSTIAFVRKLVDRCSTMCDDQQVLTDMIASPKILGIEWDGNDNNTNQHEDSEQFRKARTGRSAVTGHRVKIWDQNWVFSGCSSGSDLRNPQECPSGIGPFRENWVSMLPATIPAATTRNRDFAKSSPILYKLTLFDSWDRDCGTTLNLDTLTKRTASSSGRQALLVD